MEEDIQQSCIFCGISNGKVPSKKIYEDDVCTAVLDINPAADGHVLIIPKKHHQISPQIPDHELAKLFSAAKLISNSLLKSLKVEGTTIFLANGVVSGQRAPHVIVHVIPRAAGDGLDILKIPEQAVSEQQLNESGQILMNLLQKKLGGGKVE